MELSQIVNIKPIKPIFMLWFQGWGKAPPVCKLCVRSWRKHNPDWQVVLLDCHTLPAWVEWRRDFNTVQGKKIPKAAASDIIRLALLKKFGGVWADATLFCNRPLDDWLPDQDFFAFKNPDGAKQISSWFVAADMRSRMLEIWQKAVIDYWTERDTFHNYFWVHHLFAKLIKENVEFAQLWEQSKHISSFEPHHFHRSKFTGPVDSETEKAIRSDVPVFKLTWKAGPIHTFDKVKALADFHFKK